MNDHDNQVAVRPYEADGIRELDNNLPSWWVGLFVFNVIFGLLYFVYVHGLGGPSIAKEYASNLALMPAAGGGSSADPEDAKNVNSIIGDSNAIAAGKSTYSANCAPCHGVVGEGTIGPNLTDNFWLHGGTPEKIYLTISNGVVEKGMPAWGAVVGDKKVREMVAYVVSLKGSNPANGKPAQGTEEQ